MSTSKKKSKLGLILFLISAAFLIIYLIFIFGNPLNVVSCVFKGGTPISITKLYGYGARCGIKYEDANKECYSNSECLSDKCVIGAGPGWTEKQYGINLPGKCSANNMTTCFSGEVTIDEDSKPIIPPICN